MGNSSGGESLTIWPKFGTRQRFCLQLIFFSILGITILRLSILEDSLLRLPVYSGNNRRNDKPLSTNRNIVVLARGHSFRRGEQNTRLMDGSEEEQTEALRLFQEHVITPLIKQKWDVTIALDVIIPKERVTRFRSIVNATIRANKVFFRETAERDKTKYQSEGWYNSVKWAKGLVIGYSTAIFATRIDMKWKTNIPLPSPTTQESYPVLVPFRVHEIHNDVSDVFFFVSKDSVVSFEETLRRNKSSRDLQAFVQWWQMVDKNPIRAICPSKHNSDSRVGWNPLYSIVGRRDTSARPSTEARAQILSKCSINGPEVFPYNASYYAAQRAEKMKTEFANTNSTWKGWWRTEILQHHDHSWQHDCLLNNDILVLLRGHSFREGNKNSRDMSGRFEEQKKVFETLQEHIIDPLVKNKWKVSLGVDPIVLESRVPELRKAINSSINRVQRIYFRPNKGKVGTQVDGWYSSIQWAREIMPNRCPFSLLIMRVDMKWILDLPLPSPQEQLGTVLAAWSDGGKTPGQRDIVADMIFFVGQDQVRVFNETIYQQLEEQHRDFHGIQDWWAKLSEKPIEYVCSFTTDSNPAFKWNPFYSIIGRHTRTTGRTTAQIKELVATSCGNYTK